MLSWNEIQAMSPEAVAALNKKLMRRIIVTNVIIPAAIAVAAVVTVKWLEKNDPIVD